MIADAYCHTATADIEVEAEIAFAYMADGVKQGEWALGSWDRREPEPGLFVGTSLFDGRETWVRIHADRERFAIDYEVGRDPGALVFRNHARVMPSPLTDRKTGTCLVTLITWRTAKTSDKDWERTCVSHETELFMIKGRLEGGSRARTQDAR